MVKLRCKCLNISVDTVGSNFRETEGNSLLSKGGKDNFFCDKLYEVQLGVGGIQKELEFLMRQRCVEDWVVFKCLGCNTEPFAHHSVKGNERVLVNKEIQRDSDKIAALAQSKNVSPAFKVVLNPTNEAVLDAAVSYSNESITKAAALVQDHVKRYLKFEEEAMEGRIQRYAAEQRQNFVLVQTRAFNDKKAMLSILRKAAESKVEECLSDAIADVLETDSGQVSIENHVRLPGFDVPGVTNIQIIRPATTSTPHNKKEKSDIEGDHFDPMFPTAHDFPAFVESDDEESSDNSFNSRDDYSKATYPVASNYSSSVPINVPFLHTSRSGQPERLLDDEDQYEAPDNIAESIQALARSVQDSRNIFGDLPRPRVNTLPLHIT